MTGIFEKAVDDLIEATMKHCEALREGNQADIVETESEALKYREEVLKIHEVKCEQN